MSIHPAPGHTSEVFISTLLYYRPWYFLGLTASKLVLGVRIVSLDDADKSVFQFVLCSFGLGKEAVAKSANIISYWHVGGTPNV